MTFAALSFLAAACGNVVVDNTAGGTTSGSGGATTTGGDTTAGSGTIGVTTAVSSSGAGGAPTICGGKIGQPCGPNEWCHFEPSAECGNFDGTGVCQPKPGGCTDDCPGVCGCDSQFYCNACSAHEAGVDVTLDASCFAPDSYRAVNMFTNVPRFVFLKRSPTRNLCFRLHVEPNVASGWGVTSTEVSHDVHDCDFDPGTPPAPMGEAFPGMSASGKLNFQLTPAGCIVGIHEKAIFPNGPAWVPQTEPIEADGLGLEGGCP
jgi:hypothetical protein